MTHRNGVAATSVVRCAVTAMTSPDGIAASAIQRSRSVALTIDVCGVGAAPVVVGLILGPMAEQQLRRALAISQGDPTVLIHSPLAIILLGLAVLALVVPMIMRARGRGAVLSQMASDED
mgnify:CR=1 FL=1